MKLTKNDILIINTCINTINKSVKYLDKNFGIVEYAEIFKSITKIDIIEIENTSIVWQKDFLSNGYYKIYNLTLITNDVLTITIEVDENYNLTGITTRGLE